MATRKKQKGAIQVDEARRQLGDDLKKYETQITNLLSPGDDDSDEEVKRGSTYERALDPLSIELGSNSDVDQNHDTYVAIMKGIIQRLTSIQDTLDDEVEQKAADNVNSHSFNPSQGLAVRLTAEQQEELRSRKAELQMEAALPLDQTLILVKQMMKMKTENLAMKTHVKNMEALLHSNKIAVPLLMNNNDPEATPQVDFANEENNDMMKQIAIVEKIDVQKKLDQSAKPNATLTKLYESFAQPAHAIAQSQGPGFNMKKKKVPVKPPKSPRTKQREQDQLEQQMLLDVVQSAYDQQVKMNSKLRSSHDSVVVGNSGSAEGLIQMFQKMRHHCNFMEDLDSLGDMNNANKLRDVIKNEAYILAMTVEQKKALAEQLKSAQVKVDQLNSEVHLAKREKNETKKELNQAISRLYDIDFDEY